MTVARVRRLLSEKRARWEGLCRHCGLCCYEKDGRGRKASTDYRMPCLHLNTRTHECTVYERRFIVCPQCKRMTVFHAVFVRWLPDTCGYVQRYRPRWRALGGKAARPAPQETGGGQG